MDIYTYMYIFKQILYLNFIYIKYIKLKKEKQAVNGAQSLSSSLFCSLSLFFSKFFKNDSLFFFNNFILLRKSFHKRKRLSLKGVIKQCKMNEYRYVILKSDSYSSFNRLGIFSFSLFYLDFCEFYLLPFLFHPSYFVFRRRIFLYVLYEY